MAATDVRPAPIVVSCGANEIGAAPVRRIRIVDLGRHTGLIIDSADIRPGQLALSELLNSPFVEFGWGDRDFYPAKEYSIGLALRAAFYSRGSVLQVVGYSKPPEEEFREDRFITVVIPASGFDRLIEFVRSSFALDSAGQLIRLGKSLYGEGNFYTARGAFGLRNTCNSWTARALRAAGCDIAVAVRSARLMRSIAKLPAYDESHRVKR